MKQIDIVLKYMKDNNKKTITQKEIIEYFKSGDIQHNSKDISATIRRLLNEASIETLMIESYSKTARRYFYKNSNAVYSLIDNEEYIIQDSLYDMNDEEKSEYIETFLRRKKTDSKLRKEVMDELPDECQVCRGDSFIKINGDRYFEIHHIIPLSQDGEDKKSNLSKICANCHREAHYGEKKESIKNNLLFINRQ